MGYSLRVHKKRAGAAHPNRDEQFEHITELRERCAADNIPVISVDTRKKELVGSFRNPGAKWDRSPEPVNDHDFRSAVDGIAIPYGIYDTRGSMPAPSSSARPPTPRRSPSTAQPGMFPAGPTSDSATPRQGLAPARGFVVAEGNRP